MAIGASKDAAVAVIGGGVVGVAVCRALATAGVTVILLEAEDELGLAASGTNSGILHTGFDSGPGELETELILRSAALRDPVLAAIDAPVIRCGGVLRPGSEDEKATVAILAENAGRNGVSVEIDPDGTLRVPGESVTDPVAYTLGLAAQAAAAGAELRTSSRVDGLSWKRDTMSVSLGSGQTIACELVVNCAGLHADEVARMAGDESFEIFPRKGEFFVFEPPGDPLRRIMLPVPTKRTKGVLVFPSVDGKVIAGPTAHDSSDKTDWSVREKAAEEVLEKAALMHPPLDGAEPIASYAGLRPAGLGSNYVIGPSGSCPGLFNVAAIRSTGLSASLGIGEHVVSMLGDRGLSLRRGREAKATRPPEFDRPWWMRTALHYGITPSSGVGG